MLVVGGVDEAGRGSIIGPLVVAGISVRESNIAKLKELGVRDSKQLTRQAREKLHDAIIGLSERHRVKVIKPAEVDASVLLKGLNRLEAKAMAHVIGKIGAHEVYVDCCDTNPDRYRDSIASHLLPDAAPKIHSLHHADRINVVVSAASIIAKLARDAEIQKIRKRYSDIGSGYPSDERTMLFIRKWVGRKKCPPAFARKSWKPLRMMLAEMEQRTLI
ncbi:ribonuclease HII [Nitrososphaera sp.]|uniref:ribonuclease HII n=1 Tax=Nitrososphaera sp. TaxID=1971748 RepID=UPI00307DFCEA